MTYLKQNTAVTVKIGPFIDETDGKTAETLLTIAQADVRLSKNAGNMAQKNETTTLTHDEIGYYNCLLNATDTDTLGRLRVMVLESGALSVWEDFTVLPENVFDSLVGSDKLQVDAVEISNSATAANDVEDKIGNLDAAITTRATPAQVNTEVDNALVDINLDHLLKVAVLGTDVIDNSVIAQLVSKSATADFDTFDNTKNSLEALLSNADHKDRFNMPSTTTALKGGKEVHTQIKYGTSTNQVVVDYTYDPNDGSLETGTVA